MSLLPKWDGKAKPPRWHVIGHAILGPPVAFAVALADAFKAGHREARESYVVIRSYHADKWKAR